MNPNGARGIFSFTPRWTSSAPGLADGNAFADFLLGYPTTAQVGLGRAAMDANTNWGHFYIQDSWQVTRRSEDRRRTSLRVQPEHDRRGQSDRGDRSLRSPGGRFVIASDGSGMISPAANALLPFLPIPYVTSAAAGWNNSLLTPRPLRLAPRAGFAWTLPGSIEDRSPRRLRHLSESGRLQHRHEFRAESAVLRDQDGELDCDSSLAVASRRKMR